MNFVIELKNTKALQDLKIFLKTNGLSEIEQPYSVLFKDSTVTITCYASGKILIQGKAANNWYNRLLDIFKDYSTEKEESNDKLNSRERLRALPIPRIGSDESGKGDFFGPLVTVAFLVEDQKQIDWLINIGVKDSKKLSDARIKNIAPEIKKHGTYNVVIIGPKAYNNLHSKMGNVNRILAWSHAKAIENLLEKKECNFAIADQFGDESLILNALQEKGKKIELMQIHKAEDDIAVAAASILAREQFLGWINKMEMHYKIKLPKGAGSNTIDETRNIIRGLGSGVLQELSKVHFKTYQQALNMDV